MDTLLDFQFDILFTRQRIHIEFETVVFYGHNISTKSTYINSYLKQVTYNTEELQLQRIILRNYKISSIKNRHEWPG